LKLVAAPAVNVKLRMKLMTLRLAASLHRA